MEQTARTRVAGISLILVVLAGFALMGALYTHAFSDPAEVTVQTSRAGLVMGPGNKVKMRGVEIGRVGSVKSAADGVRLFLEIDRDKIGQVPSDAHAEIRASTIFGAKYVELVPGAGHGTAPLADGATIPADSVTTEVNTVFDSLDHLLSNIDVSQLNSTLTVLAQTLQGRGDDIARVAVDADAYLTRLEPLLPALRTDLARIAQFSTLGEQISPDLIAILRNATVTSRTVSDHDAAIHRLLVDLTLLGGRGAEVLGLNGKALSALLTNLRPTAATLRAYSSELPCFIKGLDRTRGIIADVIGGTTDALRGYVSVRSKMSKYTVPRDLPQLPAGGTPACHLLPDVPLNQVPVPEVGDPQ